MPRKLSLGIILSVLEKSMGKEPKESISFDHKKSYIMDSGGPVRLRLEKKDLSPHTSPVYDTIYARRTETFGNTGERIIQTRLLI